MLTNCLRVLRGAFFCAAAVFWVDAAAANAAVVDISGRSYTVKSARLAKGSKLAVVCGDSRIVVPFKSVSVMKIDPAQIVPVDGRPHFGVEIRLRDGTVIGDILEIGRCLVSADNGIKGKTSKAAYSAPFSGLGSVSILGKGEGEKQGDGEDGDDDEE